MTAMEAMAERVAGLLHQQALDRSPDALRVASALAEYVSLLQRWNRTHNLTGFRSTGDLLRLGIVDSLLPLELLPPGEAVVDVGSGAGFPAIPLAVVEPERRWILLEPRRKRASFLVEARHHLGLDNLEIRRERLAPEGPALAVVTSRAVGGIARSVAARLTEGGCWIVAGTAASTAKLGSGTLLLDRVVEASHEQGDGRRWARLVRSARAGRSTGR